MESISSENLPAVWHTLIKIELAINRLQERTAAIHTVNDFLLTPSGMEKLDAACMVLITCKGAKYTKGSDIKLIGDVFTIRLNLVYTFLSV